AEFYPRTKMRWEWNEHGDDKVGALWGLMKRLSESRSVVYSKWFQGRATFFSRELFTSMLCVLQQYGNLPETLTRTSRVILEILENDSPLSTKQLKKLAELQGKDNEAEYNRSLKELFAKQLIVAFGEVHDGAFPSLAIGATRFLYEDLWEEAKKLSPQKAQKTVEELLPTGSKTRRYLDKILKDIQTQQANVK
ncbi:MAG: hypothetical protein IT287_09065, partial [Bdellovibrionaceae bacterium]|nr:hypothetical protein [Pseudobdellovibrionaceae bacterium]